VGFDLGMRLPFGSWLDGGGWGADVGLSDGFSHG